MAKTPGATESAAAEVHREAMRLARAERDAWIHRYAFVSTAGVYHDRSKIITGCMRNVRQDPSDSTRTITRDEIAAVVDDDAFMIKLKGLIPARVCEAVVCRVEELRR